MSRRLLGVVMAAACLVIPSVAGAQDAPWSGTWSTTYDRMVLHQEGSSVTGTYVHCKGTIVGQVNGTRLSGTWREPGCGATSGPFDFELGAGGGTFAGTWSYASDAGPPGEHPWKGRLLFRPIVGALPLDTRPAFARALSFSAPDRGRTTTISSPPIPPAVTALKVRVGFTDALGVAVRSTPALVIGRGAERLEQLVAVQGGSLPICQSFGRRALLDEEPTAIVAPRRPDPRVHATCVKGADGAVTLTLRARRKGTPLKSVLRRAHVVVGRLASGPALGPDGRIDVRWTTSSD